MFADTSLSVLTSSAAKTALCTAGRDANTAGLRQRRTFRGLRPANHLQQHGLSAADAALIGSKETPDTIIMNRKQSSGYILAFLTAATLLAFFALQAGAVTTVTTPITGTVDTTRSGDIQILVSSDGNTLSSDAGGDGIYADNGGAVSIDKMSGGPDALAISADRNGIYAGLSGDVQIGRGCGELTINSGGSDNAGVSVENGTVSSDADLVINSGGDGVYNYGGTVNLAGVSIDSKQDGIITLGEQSVTRIRPSAGYNTVSADRYGINVSQSGDVQIGRGCGELTINSGSDGIWVNGGGTVSSDADLVIKSDNYGIRNDGTVNLAGVSIDAKSFGIETSKQAVTRIRPSTDCHTISADDNYGIFVGESGNVMIGRGSGELTINSGKVGVGVGSGATVSSDADLVITSGAAGVANSDGTVNLAGVSIDAKQGNGIENMGTMVISGDHALIRAATSEEAAVAAITNSRGSVSVKTSGDVLLAAKSNASSRNASSLINNRNSGTVSIDAGGQVTFDITAQSARGLYNTSSPAFGDGITVTAAKGVNYAATATSGDAYGIEAANGAALNYGKVNNVAVTATGGDAYGLAATNGGTLSGDGANSISNLSVTENTAGKTAYGVYASGDSKAAGVSIDQLTVKSAGSAYGVNIASDKASSIDITNGLTVSGADANGGAGIYITGAGHSVNVGGALKATGVQYGVYNSGGAVNLAGVSIDAKGSGVSVNGDGQSIVSISPASGYDTINADDSGIAVNHSGKVLIGKGSGTLNINSGAHGVYAADGGIVSSDADLVIKSSRKGVFNHGGTVNLAGVSIDAKNDLGIYNQGGSLVISGDQTLVKAETTGSSAAYAISNNNSKSGSVSIDAVSVQLTARSAHGAAAAISNTGSGAVSIDTGAGGMELIVSAASGDAAAVSNTGDGTVSIKTAGQISYDITAQSAKGMYNTTSLGTGVTVSAAKGSSYKVTSTSGDAYGIAASDNTTLAYGKVNNVAVSATSGNAYGLAATNGGKVSGDGANSIKNVSVKENTAKKYAYGVYAHDGSSITGASIDKLTVDSAGYGSGIDVAGNSSADLTVGAMSVSGDMAAYGVNANGGSVKLAMNGDMAVKSAGDDANGVYAVNSDVRFTGAQALTVSADNGGGDGIFAQNSSVSGDAQSLTVSANSSEYVGRGIHAWQSGDVKLALNGDLTVEGRSGVAEGIIASTNSDVKFTGVKAMSVSSGSGGAYGIQSYGSTVSGDLAAMTVTAAESAQGIHASDSGVVNLNAAGSVSVTSKNDSAYGVSAVDKSTVSGDLTSMKVTASGLAEGISAVSSSDVKLEMSGDLSVESKNGTAYGIDAETSSDVTFKGMKAMTVSGDSGDAYGIYAYDNSTVSGDLTSMKVTASGHAKGISAVNSSDVKLAMSGDLSVESKNDNAYGISAGTSSDVTFTGMKAMTVSGDGSQTGVVNGINAFNSTVSGDLTSMNVYGADSGGTSKGILASSSDVKLAMSGDLTVFGKGHEAAGIQALNSSDVTFTGMQAMTVSGDFSWMARGIYANNSTVSGDVTSIDVTSASGSAAGIIAADSGVVNLNAAGPVSITSKNGSAYGIDVSSDKVSSINIAKDLTVKGATGGAGITASGAAHQITVGGLTDVSIAASGDNGVYAADNSNVNLNGGASIDVTGTGEVSGIAANGGSVTVGGNKAIVKASTTGDGAKAYAINNTGSGDITINNTGDVELTASSVSGDAAAIGNSGTGKVTVATSGQISYDITSQKAKGMYNTTSLGAGVTVNAAGGSNYKITSTNGDAYGLESDKGTLEYGKVNNITVSATGGDAYGLAATDGGSLSGDANSPIASLTVTAKTAGKTAYGVLVSGDKSSAKLSPIEKINVSSAGSGYGLYANSSTDVSGTVRDITVSASNDAYGIYAPDEKTNLDVKVTGVIKAVSETGKAVSIYSKAGIITTDARSADIIGDVVAENGSKQAINMTSSDLTGAVNATGGATVGLSLDAKSVWNVTGDSSTNSELAVNGGTVNFYGNDGDNKDLYRKVIVKTLSGTDGKFLMHADIESGKGDQIVADNSDNLFGKIEIISPKKTGPYRARMADDLVIVRNDKNSSFTLVNNGGCYEYGAWKFVLASEDLSGAALASVTGVSSLAAASDTSGLGWYLLNTQQVSSTATAVFDSLMAPTIGHLEEGALYSQLGDQDWITSGDRTHVWGYAVYSKFKYTDHVTTPIEGTATGDNYAENKYYGLTGGMDKVVHESDSGTFRLGAMMGYGEGDLDMDNGDASDNSFHAGVYGIYRFNSGLYLAGIAKYNRYRTDVTARPTEGGAYEASYNQDGFGISALAGKRFDLRNSWYVEPQAELGLARIGSASYTINNSDVEIDSTNSVRGRLGFALGRKVLTSAGKTLDFYVKASIIREFDGETDLLISGDPFKADFGGTWGQYKLGINYWNNDNFMLHGALVYENGENYESPIGVELGLNWFTGPKTQKDEAEAAAEVTE